MKTHRQVTAFYIETLLLVLVFVGIILVLTGVFSLAKRESREAELLSDAVTLSQNAAEAVSAADSEEELLTLLNRNGNAALGPEGVSACYDTQMRPDPSGALWVGVTWQPESTEGGVLVRSRITVTCQGRAEPIYALDTASFIGEVAP